MEQGGDGFSGLIRLKSLCRCYNLSYLLFMPCFPSGQVLWLVLVPDKLAVTQFVMAFWPGFKEHGIPDQLVTDKGWESVVAAWFVNKFWELHHNEYPPTDRKPHRAIISVSGQMRVEKVIICIGMKWKGWCRWYV